VIALSGASEPRCDHPERSEGSGYQLSAVSFQQDGPRIGTDRCDLCESVACFSEVERGNELRFEVKGQEYFLAFVEQENRFYVFAPTPTGMQRMPVYVDAVKYERAATLRTDTHLSS